MLRDNREYDFSALSERISAQTEAYVEFSNALVKIIEQTASIRDKISENNSHLVEDYRDLNSKFQQLLLDFNKFVAENNNAGSNLNRNIDYLKNRFDAYENKLEEMVKETESKNAAFFKIFEEIDLKNKSTNKLIADNHTSMSTKVGEIHSIVQGTDETIKHVILYFKIAMAILGTIGMLVGFKILSIDWFQN